MSPPNQKIVLLTTPHELCPPDYHAQPVDPTHPCDTASQLLALPLVKELGKRGIAAKLIRGNINRRQVDLNRRQAAGTPFDREFLTHLPEAKVFLDLHSFPNHYDPWSGQDVVLLSEAWPAPAWVRHLAQYLRSRGLRTKIVRGANNYLTATAVARRTPAILVEQNESGNPKEVAAALADFLATTLPSRLP